MQKKMYTCVKCHLHRLRCKIMWLSTGLGHYSLSWMSQHRLHDGPCCRWAPAHFRRNLRNHLTRLEGRGT